MNTDLLIMRIKGLCTERGITMTTAFNESGVGKNFKSNLPSVSKKNLHLLANYFNVSVEYLTGEESDAEYTSKIAGLVVEWLEDNMYEYSEEDNTVVISKNGLCVKYSMCDFLTECKSIKTSSEEDSFNLAMGVWERKYFQSSSCCDVSNNLSAQEQTLIELFRGTTEEGRLEMISAFMTIKTTIEKKSTGENMAFVG